MGWPQGKSNLQSPQIIAKKALEHPCFIAGSLYPCIAAQSWVVIHTCPLVPSCIYAVLLTSKFPIIARSIHIYAINFTCQKQQQQQGVAAGSLQLTESNVPGELEFVEDCNPFHYPPDNHPTGML
jgi:hypothetical protein